jgi:Domain of unknown function (DUF4406)
MTTNGPHVYIAGPMDSVGGNYNFPLFDYVASGLRAMNCTVFSPADHAREVLGPQEKIFAMDKVAIKAVRKSLIKYEINWIIDNANFVFMLPGWERSEGAKAERQAAIAVGIPVHEAKHSISLMQSDDEWTSDFCKTVELPVPME